MMKDFGKALGWAIVTVAILFAFASWTDRSLDWWLTYFKGTPTDCPMWLSAIATLLPISFPFNIITELARLAL